MSEIRQMTTIEELRETVKLIADMATKLPKRIKVCEQLPVGILEMFYIGEPNPDVPALLVGFRITYDTTHSFGVNVPDWADNPDIVDDEMMYMPS